MSRRRIICKLLTIASSFLYNKKIRRITTVLLILSGISFVLRNL